MNRNRTASQREELSFCAPPSACAWQDWRGDCSSSCCIKRIITARWRRSCISGSAVSKRRAGRILDRNGTVIADNRTVCTISVIHNQVKDPETVIRVLSEELGLPEAEVRKKTEKRSSREVIQSNVEKTRGRCDPGNAPGGGQGG